jgi:hypothetical protein
MPAWHAAFGKTLLAEYSQETATISQKRTTLLADQTGGGVQNQGFTKKKGTALLTEYSPEFAKIVRNVLE